ncbi:MAG: Acidobacterial duplicated orphan permease (function unknown) [uncultured Chthoniobacterales bacterium]|uniref:ABC transporter permease n=1 Tax=uncultured Chthoniobacterales bacterium TaxID=1836801 RepID=A0A6J4HEX9_9BACT|nr:MAG: Acidobacterial duplicated orphan permease (function unknown) [uncultured Chthoniobacterales bacterium]
MIADFKYAIRLLVKTPGFTIIAVLAIALGIGASTTAFSIVNAVILRPFPFMQNQDRLVFVTPYQTKMPEDDGELSFPDYLDIKKQATTLDGLGVWQNATFIVTSGDTPERFLGANITAETFSFLGVQPILGRNFRADESDLNAAPVALIGYHVWQNLFGGDASIVGKQVPINGRQVTIIGVMPRGWRFPERNDIWMPLQFTEQEHTRSEFFLDSIGRLKDGVSFEQATAELQAIGGRIATEHPATHSGSNVRIKYYREKMAEEGKDLVLLIMGAVIFVHLIACANVANLLLARGATRTREVAVRCALGASRGAIIRGLLAESLVLGAAGSVFGLIFAVWGIDLMVAAIPTELPFWVRFDLDWRIFIFALITGILSSVVFGLLPALQASNPQLVDALKEGGRTGAASGKSQRVRNVLVVAEVALALTLLIGAGLMLRSFMAIQKSDLGMDPRNTLTFRVGLPQMQYPDKEEAGRFFEQLIPRLANISGVEAAGATTSLPASGSTSDFGVVLEGDTEPQQLQDARMGNVTTVTPGFLQACSIAVLRGRDFSAADTQAAPRVALIDERAARTWFPHQDPIGRQIRKFEKLGDEPQWLTVVGVVRDVVYDQREKRRLLPGVYTCAYQNPQWFLSVAMRTKSDPKAFVNVARTTVLSVNKDIPIYNIFSMEEVVAESYWEKRFFGWMFAIFAGLALFLASLGLYGVMSYSVRQRTQEIGVRIALGAQSSDVLRLITGQGLRLIVVGLAIGFFSAYFLTKLMASSLEVSAHDPLSFVIVGALLFTVGLVACYIPARTAMRLDPIVALRHE